MGRIRCIAPIVAPLGSAAGVGERRTVDFCPRLALRFLCCLPSLAFLSLFAETNFLVGHAVQLSTELDRPRVQVQGGHWPRDLERCKVVPQGQAKGPSELTIRLAATGELEVFDCSWTLYPASRKMSRRVKSRIPSRGCKCRSREPRGSVRSGPDTFGLCSAFSGPGDEGPPDFRCDRPESQWKAGHLGRVFPP